MRRKIIYSLILLVLIQFVCQAQPMRDKGIFKDYKNEFWEEIKKSLEDYEKKNQPPPKKSFRMDFSGYDLPKSIDEFKYQPHLEPVSQGNTGTCWAYAATSFLESEMIRLYNRKIKLSEMFTVYWQYIEKARRFVKERGNSLFAEGSQANAVVAMWRKYGCVPYENYTGLQPGQPFPDHSKMFKEMNDFLQSVKSANAWNEEFVINTIKTILNHYLGEPPTSITYENKRMTPIEFINNIVKLNLDDYYDVMSLMSEPYYQRTIYDVPDNWWKDSSYINVPLDDFMNIIKNAIKSGYTMVIGGDVSEVGYDSYSEVAMIPTFDIPSEYIDENARQFRFSNGTTTDDHGIHLIGYKEVDDKFWFLIKDSGSGSRNGKNKGYYFYHEDYVKLKMMSIFVNKAAISNLLKRVLNN